MTIVRGTVFLAAGVATLAVLAGCGSGGATSAGGGAAGTAAAARATGRQVVVTETDYHLRLSPQSLRPGRTTFLVVNKGRVAHSLGIDGPGVSAERLAGTLAPGSSKRLTVTLQRGSYEIFCPVDGHKRLGMDVRASVGGTSGSGGMPTTTTTPSSGYGYGGGGY